jgi:hypothetical protein
MFSSNSSPNSQTVQQYNGIQVGGSTYAQALPLLYGQRRVPFTLLWYGDFVITPNTDGGAGKGGGQQSPSSYFYNAAFVAGLCEGPIGGVYTVFHDQAVSTLTEENMSLSLGGSAPTIWPFLTSNFPSQAIPYDHIAYVATENYAFGTSASMPNLTFETLGFLPFSLAHGVPDCDPSVIIPDYLTDPNHGAGFKGTIASLAGNDNYQGYCLSLGIVLSPLEDTQRNANDFLKEILQITNSDIVMSVGTMKIIPYADAAVSGTMPDGSSWSYTPSYISAGVLYAFNDDDYLDQKDLDPVKVMRKAIADTSNDVPVEYCDRSNQYNTALVEAQDLYDIGNNGRRAMSTLSFHEITNATTALQVANLILNGNLYERNTYEFKVRYDFCLLEPMDYISLTDSRLGLVNQVVRITEISVDQEDIVTIKAMEVSGTARTTPIYNWDAAAGYVANYAVDSGNVQTPVFLDATSNLVSTTGGRELWIAVDGYAANPDFWGCNIYMSFDGTTYQWVGASPGGGSRYGTIGNGSTGIGAVADPDTTSTLRVNLNNSLMQMNAGTASDWNQMRTLIAVDSGANLEIMSYENCSLVSAGVYNLSNLRRGLYGTPVAAHANGAQFVRLDGNVFQMEIDPGWIGQTLYFKFASFNIYGVTPPSQLLSGLSAFTHTIAQSGVAYDGVTQGSFSTEGFALMFSPTSVVKSQAGNGTVWDSSAYSSQGFTNGCSASGYIAPVSGGPNGLAMIGLSFNPTASVSYTNLAYGIYAAYYSGANAIEIWEGGTKIGGEWGTWVQGDLLQVIHDGKHVSYYHNGVFLRSVIQGNATFFMQVPLLPIGAAFFGLSFTASATVVTPFTLKTLGVAVAAVGTMIIGNNQDATSHFGYRNFQSVQSYLGGCECSCASLNAASHSWTFGLSTAPTTGDSTGVAYLFAGWANYATTSIQPILNGAAYGSALSAMVNTDVLTITYDNFTVRWYRNGALVNSAYYPSAGALFLFGDLYDQFATLSNVFVGGFGLQSPNPFVGYGTTVCHDSTAVKLGSSSAWDSAAWSINAYGACHVQGKINLTSESGMIGLSTTPTPPNSTNYTVLNFAIYDPGGAAYEIYEGGSLVLTTTITPAATDLLVIAYDGSNVVTYSINGIVVKTTTGTGVLSLYAGMVMYGVNSGFNSVSFGPGTQIDSVPSAGIDENAATFTAIAASSSAIGPNSYGGTGVWFPLITVTVPVPTQAAVIEVTGFVQAQQNTGSAGDCFVGIGYAFKVGPLTFYTWDGGFVINSNLDQYPIQAQFTASSIMTGEFLVGIWSSNSGDSIYVPAGTSIQVEVIRK